MVIYELIYSRDSKTKIHRQKGHQEIFGGFSHKLNIVQIVSISFWMWKNHKNYKYAHHQILPEIENNVVRLLTNS
jgi:hypothetical protein